MRAAACPGGDLPSAAEVLCALEAAGSAPALHDALRVFDIWWQMHVDLQEGRLFAALIESMAGSDAVCLHDMAERASREHRAIEALRRRAGKAATPFDADASQPVAELVAQCRQHLAAEAAELLPMSARLLGDAEAFEFTLALR